MCDYHAVAIGGVQRKLCGTSIKTNNNKTREREKRTRMKPKEKKELYAHGRQCEKDSNTYSKREN